MGIDCERIGEHIPKPLDLINSIRLQLIAAGLSLIFELVDQWLEILVSW